jgi:2-polyprenyl-3-methyl-5-hydroxy-6-metoxy-1,4-benzoquinol methylase
MDCRYCNNQLKHRFIDLGYAPPSNSYLNQSQLNEPETFFPLKVFVCDQCWLVQVDEYKKHSEIFNDDYAYFSSYSKSWLAHSLEFTNDIICKLKLNEKSLVIEIASNDGYLLQYFIENNIPCLGIEPTENTAKVAKEKGIEVITKFFNSSLANKLKSSNRQADLIIGNNVLAHDPNINGFVEGLKLLLKPRGTVTIEFPHLLQLIEKNQFDTIYHEHFSYLSLHAVLEIFNSKGLEIYDVDELHTHGGSLRIYAKHKDNYSISISKNVHNILNKEKDSHICDINLYKNFQKKAEIIKYGLLSFLLEQKKMNKRVYGYGAAAKGNTLLNFCGINNDLIEYVVDISPYKQHKFLPGSHIPIVDESFIKDNQPDYIIIFPWNLKDEIVKQLQYIEKWGGKFVIFVPKFQIL